MAAAPARLSTILGSCVSLCLWDTRRKLGGMNHVLLPQGRAGASNRFRYANVANKALLERMIATGSRIHDIVARVYGGATMFIPAGGETESLGSKNVGAATDFLRSTGIPLAMKDTGGCRARKVVFDVETGQASVVLL